MGESPSIYLLSTLINVAVLINGHRHQRKQRRRDSFREWLRRQFAESAVAASLLLLWTLFSLRCGSSCIIITDAVITIIVTDAIIIIITIAAFTNYIMSISLLPLQLKQIQQ